MKILICILITAGLLITATGPGPAEEPERENSYILSYESLPKKFQEQWKNPEDMDNLGILRICVDGLVFLIVCDGNDRLAVEQVYTRSIRETLRPMHCDESR